MGTQPGPLTPSCQDVGQSHIDLGEDKDEEQVHDGAREAGDARSLAAGGGSELALGVVLGHPPPSRSRQWRLTQAAKRVLFNLDTRMAMMARYRMMDMRHMTTMATCGDQVREPPCRGPGLQRPQATAPPIGLAVLVLLQWVLAAQEGRMGGWEAI